MSKQQIYDGLSETMKILGYGGIAEDVKNGHKVRESTEMFLRMAKLAGKMPPEIEDKVRLLLGRIDKDRI